MWSTVQLLSAVLCSQPPSTPRILFYYSEKPSSTPGQCNIHPHIILLHILLGLERWFVPSACWFMRIYAYLWIIHGMSVLAGCVLFMIRILDLLLSNFHPRPAILTEVVVVFYTSSRKIPEIVPQIGPYPLPSIPFSIRACSSGNTSDMYIYLECGRFESSLENRLLWGSFFCSSVLYLKANAGMVP
jgi:hypothetical protein